MLCMIDILNNENIMEYKNDKEDGDKNGNGRSDHEPGKTKDFSVFAGT